MAQSIIDRAWRRTTPDDIEPDLAGLWRDIAKQRAVARAVMSNLVVVRERTGVAVDGPQNIEALTREIPLDEVVARHPSRVIVIQHDRVPGAVCAPSAVSVGIATFGPPHAQYGVEQIVVQSACAEQSLPSIVRRLLRGDVPTSVWWTDDVSQAPPLAAIVAMARQLIYDSRRWRDLRRGVQALAPLIEARPTNATHQTHQPHPAHPTHLDLADLNWRRLTPLRHTLIQACEPSELEHLRDANVHIVHRAGEEALAWLAVGWLAARMNWTANTAPRVEDATHDGESDELISISVGPDLTAALNDHRVLVNRRGASGFTVSVPQEGEADAVAAELRNLGQDACLHDALSALLARLRI